MHTVFSSRFSGWFLELLHRSKLKGLQQFSSTRCFVVRLDTMLKLRARWPGRMRRSRRPFFRSHEYKPSGVWIAWSLPFFCIVVSRKFRISVRKLQMFGESYFNWHFLQDLWKSDKVTANTKFHQKSLPTSSTKILTSNTKSVKNNMHKCAALAGLEKYAKSG